MKQRKQWTDDERANEARARRGLRRPTALAAVLLLAGCATGDGPDDAADAPRDLLVTNPGQRPASPRRRLYLDVHRLGPGNVSAADVAAAHEKDLAVQGAYDVDYVDYWVDEEQGTIFCLVEAPSAPAAADVHREAHGLLADEIFEVAPGILPGAARGDRKLFLDTHLAGAGGVHAEDVAEAHRKDLAVQDEFGVNFLEYWVDETSGRIHCLAEAPDREAVVAAHEKAHGLVPDAVNAVVHGK